MPLKLLLLTLAASILLGGCASAPTSLDAIADWDSYQQRLQQQEHWQLSAKLGVRSPSESGSAYLNWQQQSNSYRIHLSGPLGQGSVHINGSPEQVRLTRSGEPELSAASAEELLQQTLGWGAPIAQLKYWVRGLPAPNKSSQQTHNAQGALAHLQQSGWSLEYSRYRTVDGFLLPGKIIARQGELKLTLIIKDWALTAAL